LSCLLHRKPLPRCRAASALLLLGALLPLPGCPSAVKFPDRACRVQPAEPGELLLSYDLDGDRRVDYQTLEDAAGRIVELRYPDAAGLFADRVPLDQIDPADLPHFIIALDGVPFELVDALYRQGRFRLFYPPTRLISTFPSMTDLAFWKVFGGRQPLAYEAEYFDRAAQRLVPGNQTYLSGANADWARRLDYRCSFAADAFAYLCPTQVFEQELRGMDNALRRKDQGTAVVYSVGTAGLATQGGRQAILSYLRQIDRFAEQLVRQRRGRVRLTLLADHGHNMAGRGRVRFDDRLRHAGFRVRNRLDDDRDVVIIEYGLVTYAALYTRRPDQVADVLLADPAVSLACYPQDDRVVLRTLTDRAAVEHADGRYRYQAELGDPLDLLPVVAQLQRTGHVDDAGFIDDRALLAATACREYPDPLHRLWQAFHGLVDQPPDLVVCLQDGWCHGSGFFHTLIGGASSTHGSLNRLNSATFALTMWAPLPDVLRPEDVLPALQQARAAALRCYRPAPQPPLTAAPPNHARPAPTPPASPPDNCSPRSP